MNIAFCRYTILLFAILSFGCSLSQVPGFSHQNDTLLDIPAASNSDQDDASQSEILSSLDEGYGENGNPILNEDKEVDSVVLASEEQENIAGNNTEKASDQSIDKEKSNVKGKNGEEDQNLLDTALDLVETSQEYWSEGNLEKAIETLDQTYTLILKVNADNKPKLIQQKEDLRFMISKRILEIYSSRYTAVNGNHKAIPLVMNKHVESEIKLFQGPERKFFIDSYKRSGRYRGEIVPALKEAGLPEELSWLPLIESGFKVKALSRARALGLWQFIPSTGYKFGLKRDLYIDERLDPAKSTAAAISYLKELHQIFGDWTTVLAGYNCGEGAVLRVIRDQRINYLDNFWDLYERLPRETARYVPRFMATLHILKDPIKYGFTLDELDQPIPHEAVTIEKPVQLKKVAQKLDVSPQELSALNPELRRQVTPKTPYALKVPPGHGELLLAKLDEIPKWTPPKRKYVYHRVRRGETLSVIAMKYRTSVSQIVRANKIRRKHFIRTGQRLKIPVRTERRYRSVSKAKIPQNGKYRVRKGDTLWRIAQKFNTNTRTLKQINNLQTTRLYVGQILKVRN